MPFMRNVDINGYQFKSSACSEHTLANDDMPPTNS